MRILASVLGWCALAGCGPADADKDDDGADAPAPDGDADSDADSDADTDADADADSDADTDPIDADRDGTPADADCDDADPEVYPGAPDVCGDDRVTDCDRTTDDGLVTVDGGSTFTRVDDALRAATSGSEVRVCGTFLGFGEAVVPVALVGHGGRERARIDAVELAAALTVVPGTSITGLTVTGGRGFGRGGGVSLSAPGELTLVDSDVIGNTAVDGGGVGLPDGSVLTVSGTRIDDNEADYGGGIHAGAGSTLVLGDSTVAGNEAWYGGGLWIHDGTLTGGVITGNAAIDGGGVVFEGSCSASGSEWSFNQAGYVGSGGGFWINGATTLDLVDVRIHHNTAWMGGGGAVGDWAPQAPRVALLGSTAVEDNTAYYGGGLSLSSGAIATGGVVTGNTATYEGGGIHLAYGRIEGMTVAANSAPIGGGVRLAYFSDPAEIRDCTIEGNTADRGGGIGAGGGFPSSFTAVVSGTTVAGNTADEGGGLYAIMSVAVVGSTFTDNAASTGAGVQVGAPERGDSVGVTVTGSTVARNAASVGGGGAYLDLPGLISTDSDWGADADDNLPGDVFVGGVELGGYGPSATFRCADVCDPLPNGAAP